MTFSGTKESIRKSNITVHIRNMLDFMGFKLNDKKTVFINSSQQQRITGVVVNEKPQIPRELRRDIRQDVYYCKKYGVKENILHKGLDISETEYLHSLLGRISYALQIDPNNTHMQQYFNDIKTLMNV